MVYGSLRGSKLTVIILIIAFFLFGNVALAEKMKISAQQAEEIKTVLGITQTILNISKLIVNNNDWATLLNKAIGVGQTGTDATYGLLVLSALNEMDLMDLVLSQRYKTEARDYFNKVLDERTNLLAYWKGVGFDIPRVASGYITGPMAGLTLNSFAITDKAIAIFGEFHILKTMKLYDGLWYYFDLRKQGNESHKIAWAEAKIVMNWAMKKSLFSVSTKINQGDEDGLEIQFSALYEKWGPYATPYGISEKYKEQARTELRNTLVAALEAQSLAQAAKESKPSLLDKLLSQFIKLKDMAAALISQINPFKAGPIIDLSKKAEPEEPEESIRLSLTDEEKAADVGFPPIKAQDIESTENLTEDNTVEIPLESTPEIQEPETIQEEPQIEPAEEPPPAPSIAPVPELAPTSALCQQFSDSPARFKVLINEIAWMGTNNSVNDEWIVVIK